MPEGTNSISLTAGPRHVPRRSNCADKRPADRQRGWPSALFAAKRRQFDSPSANASTSEARAEDLQRSDARSARPPTTPLQADGLFVARSPSGEFRRMSNVFVGLTARQVGGGQPINGRQDKSAAVWRAHVVGWIELFSILSRRPAGGSDGNTKAFSKLTAIAVATRLGTTIGARGDELRAQARRLPCLFFAVERGTAARSALR
jgi:hypothetical protein